MSQSQHESYSVVFDRAFNGRSGACCFLVIVIIGLVLFFNPTPPRLAESQASVLPFQTGTSTYTGLSSTGALNLTNANANASRSFSESSWISNSTTAQVTINSSDSQGETVAAVWRLDPAPIVQAQIIKYDFAFATNVRTPGPSGPTITASVGLSSENYQGWYYQSRTPIYPNNTETVSIVNVEGSYPNGSFQNSLLFQEQRVTNAQPTGSGGSSAILFQQEIPRYAAGDGVFHRYSIEIDLQSNRTIWIADDQIVAIAKLSFVPANMVFVASAASTGDSAIATFKDPVQLAIPAVQTLTVTGSSSGSASISTADFPASIRQISSLQNQVDHLNNQVGNLTRQNLQLQAKNSQWFSQWWASIIWSVLGAGLVGVLFVTGMRLKTRQNGVSPELRGEEAACSQCGGAMPPDATFCGECGTPLRETTLGCPECGRQMPAASVYCGECGTRIPTEDPVSKNVAELSAREGRDEKDALRR